MIQCRFLIEDITMSFSCLNAGPKQLIVNNAWQKPIPIQQISTHVKGANIQSLNSKWIIQTILKRLQEAGMTLRDSFSN